MQKQQSGHIVTISSIAGKFGFYWRSAYAASKHALQGFFESLYLEEAKNNIYVTLVYPGKINTPISLNAINEYGQPHGVMDHNQKQGMDAAVCAKKIIRAVELKKQEVLIGNKEILAVYFKRYCPWLFWRIIRKQTPTGWYSIFWYKIHRLTFGLRINRHLTDWIKEQKETYLEVDIPHIKMIYGEDICKEYF